MTRMILIHDELNRDYKLVTGNSRIEIVLRKTVQRQRAGYSKVLDVELPIRQTTSLELGEVKSDLTLEVYCTEGNLETRIDDRQRHSLEVIVNNGVQQIKSRIETLVSYIKTQASGPGTSPYQTNQVLVSFFPEIMRHVSELLELATREPNLSFLTIRSNYTLNLSSNVDKLVAQDHQNRVDMIKQIAIPDLTTPFPPEEELEIRYQHFERIMDKWPSSVAPSFDDYESIAQLIDQQRNALSKDLHLQLKSQGSFDRILEWFRGND